MSSLALLNLTSPSLMTSIVHIVNFNIESFVWQLWPVRMIETILYGILVTIDKGRTTK